MKNKPYTDLVHNLAVSTKAWKTTSYLLGAALITSIVGLTYLATHATTVLIPESVASAKGPVKVADKGRTAADYLSLVASADLSYALNWTPDTVSVQFSRFLNRTTPTFYASQQVQLTADALDHTKNNETQAFYPVTSKLLGDNVISVTGTLARWVGDKQVFRQTSTYLITYTEVNGGMPYVDSLINK
jgi:hypothetical protein